MTFLSKFSTARFHAFITFLTVITAIIMNLRAAIICLIPLLGFELFGQDDTSSPKTPVAIEVQTSKLPPNRNAVVIEAITEPVADLHQGYKDGHQWVDLGLPSGTKWATLNVGATDEKDFGDYFSWGEIKVKDVYDEKTSLTSGVNLRRISGKPRYDAVTHYWGKNWRLPTEEQIVELVNNTDAQEIKENEDTNLGILLTSKINGATIFFPSGGMKGDDMVYAVGDMGFFWSGSEFSSVWDKACFLMISPYGARLSDEIRCVGANVRGVTK